MTEKKTELTAGADERTPSHSQYFSWINNTNEGSTQEQTLINLNYFKFLRDEYGMQLDIYAWDAGNLDGSMQTYQTPDSPKIREQYPQGYAPIAKAAAEIGTRLGVWCGPDGFGDTPEQAQARKEMMVSLCRDNNFALFKMDGVCGKLRKAKQTVFIEMMKECRKYQPDLVLLNHRLDLGRGLPYATTFLWEGLETYIDVHVANPCTALHNRAYMFSRSLVPGLERLTEDHGVCISSSPDYFEDDLIYQAFNRCLILAPEIYGNPWLLRDDEQARLAHIYNLHRHYREILVDAKVIPAACSKNCTARGDGKRQFVTLGNCSWKTKKINMKLDETIGLKKCGSVAVIAQRPFKKLIGVFGYGESAPVEIEPFRAALIEVCDLSLAGTVLTGCEYEVLHETNEGDDKVKVVSAFNSVKLVDLSSDSVIKAYDMAPFDNTAREPALLARAENCPLPANAEQLVEATLFCADNDSLEARSLKRSGETKRLEIKAARDAFFNQERYFLRGCENRFAFDGKRDTYFDGCSKLEFGGMRVDGGCLRVDFGEELSADYVKLEYFAPFEAHPEFDLQALTDCGSFSADLLTWKNAKLAEEKVQEDNAKQKYIHHSVHDLLWADGQRKEALYEIGGEIKYFRLPCPPDRLFKIALVKNGKELVLKNPRANNLFRAYEKAKARAAASAAVRVEKSEWREGCFLAVALDGKCGCERAYAAAEIDGMPVGFPERAAAYPGNCWECPVRSVDGYYTYFLPISESMAGKEITVTVLTLKGGRRVPADIYLCDGNLEKSGIKIDI